MFRATVSFSGLGYGFFGDMVVVSSATTLSQF